MGPFYIILKMSQITLKLVLMLKTHAFQTCWEGIVVNWQYHSFNAIMVPFNKDNNMLSLKYNVVQSMTVKHNYSLLSLG